MQQSDEFQYMRWRELPGGGRVGRGTCPFCGGVVEMFLRPEHHLFYITPACKECEEVVEEKAAREAAERAVDAAWEKNR